MTDKRADLDVVSQRTSDAATHDVKPNFQTGPRVFQESISASWLRDDSLWICFVQPAPPAIQKFEEDQARPDNVFIASQLLGPQSSILKNAVGSDDPSVTIFPELAFGSSDWDAIDALINNYPLPLIFIAGFSCRSGILLNQLVSKSSPQTIIQKAWREDTVISEFRRYNGGWCWIKIPNKKTKCLIFLKNYPQQSYESRQTDLALGKDILRIDFNDLTIFPLICADLLYETADGSRPSAIERIHQSIPTIPHENRIAVFGLLYQDHSSEFWLRALDSLMTISPKEAQNRLTGFLTNYSVSKKSFSSKLESFRQLTGVYYPRHKVPSAPPHPIRGVRHNTSTHFASFNLRCDKPSVLVGQVGWQYSNSGPDYWRTIRVLPVDVHGAIERARDLAEHDELLELTRILEKVNRDECSPQASEIVASICKSSLSTLRERISLLKKEDSKRLWQAALYGFASLFHHRSPTPVISLDLMNQYEFYLRRSMRAIGILLHYLGYNIVSSAGPDEGPLRSGCVNQISTLVWCDPEQNSYAIQRQIIDWAHGRKSPTSLFVIADGTIGDFDNQIIYPSRLGDITTARDQQANDRFDISEPRVGKVFGLSLRKLETRLFASKNDSSEDNVKNDLADLVAGSLHSG